MPHIILIDNGIETDIGVGMWAVDLANQIPKSSEIHAIDVSDTCFPPNPPLNLHFSVASVTSMPSEWSNKFDFVNQRFLGGALLGSEWPTALSEIYRVLKPGGTTQIFEVDMCLLTPETPINVKIRDATWKASSALGLRYDAARSLPDWVRAAGFVDVVDETKRLPLGKQWGEIGMQGTQCLAGGFRNASGVLVKAGAFATEEEFEDLIDRLMEEWDEHGNQYYCKVVCARKPS